MEALPLSTEIPYAEPDSLFYVFAKRPWSVLLDSADSCRQLDDTNRFSYIAFDPFETIVIKDHRRVGTNEIVHSPFQYVHNILADYTLASCPELPLFQGGAVGYFSYDLCHYYEEINKPLINEEHAFADMAVGLYSTIIAFDHVLQKAWIVATGFPEKMQFKQLEKAKNDIAQCLVLLEQNKLCSPSDALHDIASDLVSRFDKKSYAQTVEKAQNYILEGDIFEVNLSHRFEAILNQPHINKYDLYRKMRHFNPSPFSAYLNFDDHQILSTSPERFLLLKDGNVSTRPIKGTAPRGKTPEKDKAIADALSVSEKDRSENVMIVDLLRNDLSKVCIPDSVKVKKLCSVETYPTVHHLVSVVEGSLKTGTSALGLLEACFPGGSITGAPKVRAMQIIYELEPTARGPYCGSIGYVGYNGAMDTSIVIRTLLVEDNKITYQAGGAVVLDSSPEGEYEETVTKSVAIRRALMDVGV